MEERLKTVEEIAGALIDEGIVETEDRCIWIGIVNKGVTLPALKKMVEVSEPTHFYETKEGVIILYKDVKRE